MARQPPRRRTASAPARPSIASPQRRPLEASYRNDRATPRRRTPPLMVAREFESASAIAAASKTGRLRKLASSTDARWILLYTSPHSDRVRNDAVLLQRIQSLMAQSGHRGRPAALSASGGKRTSASEIRLRPSRPVSGRAIQSIISALTRPSDVAAVPARSITCRIVG
jgi:hypothetical protein